MFEGHLSANNPRTSAADESNEFLRSGSSSGSPVTAG